METIEDSAGQPGEDITPLRANLDYQLLLSGRTVQMVGQSMTGLAMMLICFDLTHSPRQASLVAAAAVLAALSTTLVAGAVVDRLDRRRVMVGSALVSAAATATIPVALWWGVLGMPQLMLVTVISSAADTFFGPAETASVRRLVHASQLGQAMSLSEARGAFGRVVGPPVSGALYGLSRAMPFVVDSLFALVSALAAGLLRADLRPRPEPSAPTTFRHDLAEGFRYLARRRELLQVGAMTCIANFALAGVILTVILDMQRRGTPPAVIGMLDTVLGLCALAGAAASGGVLARWPVGWLCLVEMVVACLVFVVVMATTKVWLVMGVLGLFMVLVPSLNAGLGAYFVSRVHDHMQGRASTALGFAAMASTPVAQLMSGEMLQRWSRASAMAPGLAGMVVCVALVAGVPALRGIPRTSELCTVESIAPRA